MARLPIQTYDLSSFDIDGQEIAFTTSDSINNHYIEFSGKDILLVMVNGINTAHVTIVSVEDPIYSRSSDIILPIPGSTSMSYGKIPPYGFMQETGQLYINVDVSDLKLVAFRV